MSAHLENLSSHTWVDECTLGQSQTFVSLALASFFFIGSVFQIIN